MMDEEGFMGSEEYSYTLQANTGESPKLQAEGNTAASCKPQANTTGAVLQIEIGCTSQRAKHFQP